MTVYRNEREAHETVWLDGGRLPVKFENYRFSDDGLPDADKAVVAEQLPKLSGIRRERKNEPRPAPPPQIQTVQLRGTDTVKPDVDPGQE